MIYRKLSCLSSYFISNHSQCFFCKIIKSVRLLGTTSSADLLQDQDEYIYDGENLNSVNSEIHPVQENGKMKKYALMFSYLGKGFYGLQRSKVVPTIEEELFKAMYKAGIISKEHYTEPYDIWYKSASRTDKGVSALRQVVSLFLDRDVTEDAIERINKHLCPQIKAMGIKKVIKTFDAKKNCDARLYSYTLPTFSFCPVEEHCTEYYRLPRERLHKVNSILKTFEGVHNFQNFTSTREARLKGLGCFRNIIYCECSQPFIQDDVEFAIIRVKGQSFMLHQIRNMIGLSIAIIRGLANMETLEKNLISEKMKYIMAPALGLVLEEVIYNHYNWKFGGNGLLEPLLWEECQESVHNFKMKYVQSNIFKTELKEKSMMKWLEKCYSYSYESDTKEPNTNLYAAFSLLRRVQGEQEETVKKTVNAVPKRQ